MTLQGSLSFRSTPKAVRIFFEEVPDLRNLGVPSYTTVQRWVASVGYFKLTCPKVHADDWQVIIDLSIQMGTQKCLTILGCRRADIESGRALKLENLTPLEIRILSKVNGQAIKDALEAVREKVGCIQVICSDEGSDVLAGVRLYQAEYPKTIHIPDIAHKMANFLKHHLKDNVMWQTFCSKASEVKTNVQQTELAAIAPPAQRSKARFMNADILVDWAKKMLCLLDNPQEVCGIDFALFKEHLGWLQEYRSAIEHYARLIQITGLARHLVRTLGICATTTAEFERQAFTLNLNFNECQFVGQILDFLQEQSNKTTDIGAFIGSSEILESFFGKFKGMEGDQCKAGFTGLVLAAHAHIGKLDEETVTKALSSVKTKTVNKWIKGQVGSTIQSQRKNLFAAAKKIFKEKIGQEVSGTLEGKAMGF